MLSNQIFSENIFIKSAYSLNQEGVIRGKVTDLQTKEPIQDVYVAITGTSLGVLTDSKGIYSIKNVQNGKYILRFIRIGHLTKEITGVLVSDEKETVVDAELEPKPVQISEVVVTPGRFTVMGSGALSNQILSKKDIQNISFGEDTYRAVSRVPGIIASDYSAKFSIRGGEANEILVLFDGMQLYEPFHLKDFFGGIFSIFDVNVIDGIDIMTGGFPAEYGDRMSGVFSMSSIKPEQGKKKVSLGISLMNMRFYSQGTFSEDKGSWILSARRGFLKEAFKLAGSTESPAPTYNDYYGKINYKLDKDNELSVNLLYAGDALDFVEDDSDESHTSYNNSYLWLTLNSIVNPKLFVRSIVSIGKVNQNRLGTTYLGTTPNENEIDFKVDDSRNFNFKNIKQDWSYDLSENHFLKFGFDLRSSSTENNYSSKKTEYYLGTDNLVHKRFRSNNIGSPYSNNQYSAYVSNRVFILSKLTGELGVRYDYSSIVEEGLLSPRLNLAYALGEKTFIRGGWGVFYQSQSLYEQNIQDGENQFYPAEKAATYGIGFEHTFDFGINFRVEGYYKRLSGLRPVYRNIANPAEVFMELQNDRQKFNIDNADTKGIELFLKYDTGEKISWWVSYALAYSKEKIKGIEGEVPRPYDQRHTISLDINYRPDANWHFSIAFCYKTGWPYTDYVINRIQTNNGIVYNSAPGSYLAGRLPDYHRLDVRMNRYFYTAIGTFSLFLEVLNVYGRENVRSYKFGNIYVEPNGNVQFSKRKEYWFPTFPSFGISWTLDLE